LGFINFYYNPRKGAEQVHFSAFYAIMATTFTKHGKKPNQKVSNSATFFLLPVKFSKNFSKMKEFCKNITGFVTVLCYDTAID
jgi:hypothetical protein